MSSDRGGGVGRMLLLLLLLAVLAISRDMPTASASGIELLPMKVEWSIAWAGLQTGSPLAPPAASLALSMDPDRRTGLGRQAALYLARHGAIPDRLRWSAALARADRRTLLLFIRALDAALVTADCGLLKKAVRAARTLPRRDRATVAREFGRRRFAHWGPTGLRAGLHVSNLPELRRALLLRRRPTTGGNPAPCSM